MASQEHTSHLKKNSPTLNFALKKQLLASKGTTTLERNEVILLIRGMPERLLLNASEPCILGRFDGTAKADIEFDLSPFGANERGVSRHHAALKIEDGNIFVSDLGSTNGTFVDGQRLEPHQATLLHQGQDILLGRLRIEILFA